MEIFLTVTTIHTFAALIPTVIYFLTRKSQDVSLTYLAVMLVFSFLVDGFAWINVMWLHIGKSVNAIINFYGCIQIAIVVMLYQVQLSPGRRLRYLLLIGLLLVIQFMEMFFFRGLTEIASTSQSILSIVVTVLALSYFFELIRKLPSINIYHVPMFWINIGMLVAYTCNFFLYVVRDYLIDVMKNNMAIYWSFHNVLGIIAYVLFAIGIWQAKRCQEKNLLQPY